MGESRWKKLGRPSPGGRRRLAMRRIACDRRQTTGVENILLFLLIQPPPPIHRAKSERRRVRTVYFICYRSRPFFF